MSSQTVLVLEAPWEVETVSEFRLGCGAPISLYQRAQFLQLLLLGTFQILQPLTQQRELRTMIFLRGEKDAGRQRKRCKEKL